MQQTIKNKLQQIEQDHHVHILYACESGSRAWGIYSEDSDYDVRFIYIHHPHWYLSIDEKKDVIELPNDNLFDISGWDVRKALRLFRKSNPSLLEWLSSGIVYEQKSTFVDSLQNDIKEVFSAKSCMHHYFRMAKRNFRKELQSKQINLKPYFYMLRPILACKWIERFRTMPPIRFQHLADELLDEPELKQTIDELIERKIYNDKLDLGPRIEIIDDYIERELSRLERMILSIDDQPVNVTDRLDSLFRKTLKEAWND